MTTYAYVHDGADIYRRSFAIIRAEADLARLPPATHDMVVDDKNAAAQSSRAIKEVVNASRNKTALTGKAA